MSERNEFLFHGQRIVVTDLTAELQKEKQYLEHLISIGANDRTLTRVEKRVRRLSNQVNRTPNDGLRTLVRQVLNVK